MILAVAVQSVYGQSDEFRKQHFNIKKNVALEGYDPVSYFDGAPLEGDPDLKFVYKNVTYQFASAANLQNLNLRPTNTNLPMEDGAPTQWAKRAKK